MRLAWVLLLALTVACQAHDRKQPNLDGWYGSLQRPGVTTGFTSCCSRTDCHTTQAELRGNDWWARIGARDAQGDWDLRDWKQVPATAVLQHDNPTGEAVICHSLAWKTSAPGEKQVLNVAGVTIWCFVPPTES